MGVVRFPLVILFGKGVNESSSPHTASIHILDDDSLLNVFHFYRPSLWGEDQDDDSRLIGGYAGWNRGRWWYRLAHVCRRWRSIILGSASYLDICLVCTSGTPVSDLLAHSPPLPLVIDCFGEYHDITPEDEERTILALTQRDRVRRVRLRMPIANLQKVIAAIDDEYPILEHMVITCRNRDSTVLRFPETLQVPRLRHLLLEGYALPIGSRLLTTAVGLVTLSLAMVNPSTYFHPNTLLQCLSFMPQLETLMFGFVSPVPNRDVERQLMHTPITTRVILPNLYCFMFQGGRTYLEALVHRITTPRLEKLHIEFFNQLTFSVPRLVHFMNTTETLKFKSAKFEFFNGRAYSTVYPRAEEAKTYALFMAVNCWHLDWQVFSMAQIFSLLGQTFSAVEHLTFQRRVLSLSPEEHNTVDRIEWHKLLGSFRNVKTIRIDDGLVEELPRCLQLDDGELPSELLPELQEITYSRSGDAGDAFTSFIDARRNESRPVSLVRL